MSREASQRRWGQFAVLAIAAAVASGAPAAMAGPDQGYADVIVTMTGPAGPIPKGKTATYTAIVSNQGTADATAETAEPAMLTLKSSRTGRGHGTESVQNPFESVEPSQGSCQPYDDPDGLLASECSFGSIAPGASAQVTAVIEINEDMDLVGFAHGYGMGGRDQLTTLVDSPPVVSGSKKIKVSGVPDSCATRDFTLKAKSRGAKQISALLRGPLHNDGTPSNDFPSETKRIETEQSDRLTARIKPSRLPDAYYEVQLSAQYEKGRKQETDVFFQSCA